MANRKKRTDAHVEQILELLRREYLPAHPEAKIDAYRYNEACIQIRILDRRYAGMKMQKRWDQLWKLFQSLPEATQSNVGLMFLMTPNEAANRYRHMNWEFEHPNPTEDPPELNGEPASTGSLSNRAGRRAASSKRKRS